MNTDIFKNMVFGNSDELIEKYLQSDEIQMQITLNACVTALVHILVEKHITTEEHYKEIMELYKEEVKKRIIEKAKKELNNIMEDK